MFELLTNNINLEGKKIYGDKYFGHITTIDFLVKKKAKFMMSRSNRRHKLTHSSKFQFFFYGASLNSMLKQA